MGQYITYISLGTHLLNVTPLLLSDCRSAILNHAVALEHGAVVWFHFFKSDRLKGFLSFSSVTSL